LKHSSCRSVAAVPFDFTAPLTMTRSRDGGARSLARYASDGTG
jgi:hypothetical protein